MSAPQSPNSLKTSDLHTQADTTSPSRYRALHRRIIALLALGALIPLLLMAVINVWQFHSARNQESLAPFRALIAKTKTSLELFLAERTSTVNFIASAYSYADLADDKKLARLFQVMAREFDGFVDLGLIDADGKQVSYAGPYPLKGVDYSRQPWFNQVRISGTYLSDVFMGFRDFPHLIIAVRHLTEDGNSYVLRATLDTRRIERLLSSLRADTGADAFLVNRDGVLQVDSLTQGKALTKPLLDLPGATGETNVVEVKNKGTDLLIGSVSLSDGAFSLIGVRPKAGIIDSWASVRGDLLIIFLGGAGFIFFVVYQATKVLVRGLREAEERRELAFRQVEHNQKLSSIGRLAAGLAHEINNPLAVINEKAGLMRDLINMGEDFPRREKYLDLIASIAKTVERCKGITHRMLGFAKRMDVAFEELNVNEVLTETHGFLEREAAYRHVDLTTNLDKTLPLIYCDRGQLQQVFLNLFNNALAAVTDGGRIEIESSLIGNRVKIRVTDNGCGMSTETLSHIFEPFFTTKKSGGTGLGLSITYGIIKRLGGDIEVQSEEGTGTTFVIYLPLHGPTEVQE